MKQRSDPLSWITVDDAELSVDQFPDGSFRFTVNYQGIYSSSVGPQIVIRLKSTLPEAIVAAFQVCSALSESYPSGYLTLIVQTMPDQRADREEVPGMSNPAAVSSYLLGHLTVDEIIVFDLHSKVSKQCLENICYMNKIKLVINEPLDCFLEAIDDCDMDPDLRVDYVVAVDKGAHERARQVAGHFGAQVIHCDKKRVDGKIVGHVLDGFPDAPVARGSQVWIIDDLCDGGATFISVAKLLQDRFDGIDLHLYVTHGLFSKGKEELFKHYTTVLALFDYSEVK